jgi:DNA repair exonuclease SbcCD nuclease subunit
MKCAILGDTHFGVRNGSRSFNEYFEKFYSKVFFPYLLENDIKRVIQLGDIFDNRKQTHLQGLFECKKYFFDKFEEYDIELLVLIGNHDSFFKDTISINSPKLLLQEYSKIKIIEDPSFVEIVPNTEALILPWICKDNYYSSMDKIKTSKTDVCFAHLELKDFAMYKGIICEEGMDANIFDGFEYVFTGHYHHRSNKNNIYYLGTPYELTWQDDSDPKGFHIFDLHNRQLEFIKNPYKMFNKVYYDDSLNEVEIKNQIENFELDKYSNSYIKVIVQNKKNPYLFDLFIDSIYKINPIDLVIIEDVSDVLNEELNDVDESEDTLTILNKYIDNIKTQDIDSNKLKNILSSLYNEAVNLDSV